ncbi:MAG: hypothetical protein AAB538_03070, partial [Patescibacteria group bacterium]
MGVFVPGTGKFAKQVNLPVPGIFLILPRSLGAWYIECSMKIASPAFGHNQTIPSKYTCDGENIN